MCPHTNLCGTLTSNGRAPQSLEIYECINVLYHFAFVYNFRVCVHRDVQRLSHVNSASSRISHNSPPPQKKKVMETNSVRICYMAKGGKNSKIGIWISCGD